VQSMLMCYAKKVVFCFHDELMHHLSVSGHYAANMITYAIHARHRSLASVGCYNFLYTRDDENIVPMLTHLEPTCPGLRARAIVLANETTWPGSSFDTLLDFGRPVANQRRMPQIGENIRLLLSRANVFCERLHIYNHRTYHEKMANVSRPVALLRNIRIILASGPQKIVFWCGWYHSRLFDVLCPTVTLYDGRLKTVPSFVGIDLKLAVDK